MSGRLVQASTKSLFDRPLRNRRQVERQDDREPEDELAWARKPGPGPAREPAAAARDELDWIPGRTDREKVRERDPERERER